jgi:solute carrier family 25 (mitochondrial carnitine/acylcarnitine transporter), member 20/29
MRSTRQSLTEEALGGLSAGIVGTIIGFPLDTIKTRMQTQHHHGASSNRGMWATARAIVHTEGFLSLYKGIAPPLVSLSILNTINFASYSYFQHVFHAQRGWDVRNALAGAVCGPIASSVSTIENLVKTQMQVDNVQHKRFRGSLDAVRQLIHEHGVSIVYRGHGINTVRETAFLTTYFGLYEGVRHMLHSLDTSGHGQFYVPLSGGLAGAVAWTVTFPLDCIRAGVQGSDLHHQRTALTVNRELMATRGMAGLFSGVAPSIARAFLVSGSRFSAYEAALWLLRGGRDVDWNNAVQS